MGGIIQGGDPLTKTPGKADLYGTGGLGLFKAISDLPLVRGTVAARPRPSSVDSAGTQFFVCLMDQPSLKGQYTVYGRGDLRHGGGGPDQPHPSGRPDCHRAMKVTIEE